VLAPEPVAVPAVLGPALLVVDPLLPFARSLLSTAVEPVVVPLPAFLTCPVARSMQPEFIEDPDGPEGEGVWATIVVMPAASKTALAKYNRTFDIEVFSSRIANASGTRIRHARSCARHPKPGCAQTSRGWSLRTGAGMAQRESHSEPHSSG
jgi:hypothetical protein